VPVVVPYPLVRVAGFIEESHHLLMVGGRRPIPTLGAAPAKVRAEDVASAPRPELAAAMKDTQRFLASDFTRAFLREKPPGGLLSR